MKRSGKYMRATPHTVETPVACKKYGGTWNREWGVCIGSEDIGGGCTAPIKGAEFCWGYCDLYDEIEPRVEWRDKYLATVDGMNIYNNDTVFNLWEWGDNDLIDYKEDALAYGRSLALEVASDAMRGQGAGWFIGYRSPDGKILDRPVPHCTLVASSESDDKKKIPFRFKQRRMR